MATRKTSKPLWQCRLHDQLQRLQAQNKVAHVVVVGVGNELLGDDALGVWAARRLRSTERLSVIEAGVAPENVTGRLRALRPDWVLLIDAVQFGQPPGTVEWFERDAIAGCSASTHSLPLHVFAAYVESEIGCQVAVIGVQPESLEFGCPLSRPVERSLRRVVQELRKTLADRDLNSLQSDHLV